MIEAALAHRNYYHNDLLIEPIEKYVSLIYDTFGPEENKRHGYPGHPEIELALFRLFEATGNKKAYDLANYFVEERGNPTGQGSRHYYDVESEERGDSPWLRPDPYPMARSFWYCQAHEPILQQKTIEGHSVRAVYLLTAVTDIAVQDRLGLQKNDKAAAWLEAANRLWNNMVDKKMYLTGGIGAIPEWEGFGRDYFLPQGSDDGGAYAETCASIGAMMFAERLLHLDLDSRYADVMELSLYNVVMTAMDIAGKAFTYDNQLASSDAKTSRREEWFECSCCPPNVSRLYGSLGGYLWDFGDDGTGDAFVNVHLYTTATLSFDVAGNPVTLEQTSDWPLNGTVRFKLENPKSKKTTLRLRIPGWSAGEYTVSFTPILPPPIIVLYTILIINSFNLNSQGPPSKRATWSYHHPTSKPTPPSPSRSSTSSLASSHHIRTQTNGHSHWPAVRLFTVWKMLTTSGRRTTSRTWSLRQTSRSRKKSVSPTKQRVRSTLLCIQLDGLALFQGGSQSLPVARLA